ncbi:hypothetical protein LPJ61_000741 [Coemansia biformis]|uniref:Uncharacterized protein n=1 Tax=Coemansia biformis TaxID=1286918 RepID=A0A9W7YI94_9FUNG|nr:hypothetical protein LPJ61_000741 [Coemansia biformis]
MADSDDFNYESVVSDPGEYSEMLTSTRHTEPDHDRHSEPDRDRHTEHAAPHTPPHSAAGRHSPRGAPSDSLPSLAASTPTTERFQLEYDQERGGSRFASSQSQGGLKSGVYTNNSTSDFSERLRGDVVVSEKWSAVGDQRDAVLGAHGGDESEPYTQQGAADDTTFDIPPFSESADTMMSRLLRVSSADGNHDPAAALWGRDVAREQAQRPASADGAGPDEHHNSSVPSSPTGAQDAAVHGSPVTPKMTRSQSDRSGSMAPGLRSALRRNRPAPLSPPGVQFDSEAIDSPRKVSFAGMQPLSSPEASVAGQGAEQERGNDGDTREGGDQAAKESIVSGARSPDVSSGGADDASTLPLDAAGDVQVDDVELDGHPRPADGRSSTEGIARQSINRTTGVGMTGGMFSRFSGWSRNHLVARSPNQGLNALRIDQEPGGDSAQDTVPPSSMSSSRSASTVSPVKTEPMRSQLLSNPTTPVSSRTGAAERTTPRASSRRTSQTPSRSVNPLARHLALKAMQSTPGWSPTARGLAGTASPLADSSSGSLAGSVDSAMLGLAELQQQFDGFAGQLQRDASAVQAEVHESEQAWATMQSELQALRAQLAAAEETQDLQQRQLADADREHAEWEQERERLEEDKEALQSSVDQWRQRIGDAETERQGAWEEGAQSRQQLLHTIVRLEEELVEARDAVREAAAIQGQEDSRHQDKYIAWGAERQELLQHLEDIMGAYDGLETENRQLRADLDDRQTTLEDIVARAEGVEAECELRLVAADDAANAAKAKAAELDSANALLREALEDLTERNHELKQSRDDSRFFTTAVGDNLSGESPPRHAAAGDAEDSTVERLRRQHRNELERVNNDYQVLVETMEDLKDSKQRHKAENAELTAMAEAARDEIRRLKAQLDERGGEHMPSDELVHRTARLETELADLQSSGEAAELRHENTYLQSAVTDLGQQLRRSHDECDALRQSAAAKEVQLDDAQCELAATLDKLAALQASNTRLSNGAALMQLKEAAALPAARSSGSPQPGQAAQRAAREPELLQESRQVQSSVAALETTIRQMKQRRERLEKEQRLLASGLRDSLLHNVTLRTELAEILMRRAGLARGLQRPESQAGDCDASMASGLLSHVPSTSQLLDGNSRFVRSLDRHLDEVANIVEDDTSGGASKRRMLTPIKEEPRPAAMREAATQCDNGAEMAVLRLSLASARQERDQFRASHEESAERESRLTAQMEELGEHHERARAERITTARVALRVGRQLAVLRRALERLAAQDTANAEPDDSEDALAIAEEGEMISAAFDRPLDAGDCELFGLSADADAADAHERLGRGELSCDLALDRIGQLVSQAHLDLRRIRRDVLRGRRQRARMLTRLGELERRKLPSYELSAMWGRSCVDELEDTDPPASLLLADESAVVAEVTAARRGEQGAPVLRDRASATAEITRLTTLLARRERRLRAVEADIAKVEELNRELVQRLDRAFAERVRAQQECSVAARRTSVRSAVRVTTPGGATDWDDLDSIVQELDRCARRNTAYFGGVEQLCGVLSQHAADRELLPVGTPAETGRVPRALLDEVAAVLGARGDLDERKSVHENFTAMAAAVRRRLDAVRPADAELVAARAELTKQDATIRSQNDTAAQLRQQCMTSDAKVHELRLERDGWQQQCMANEQALNYQLVKNDRLACALADASELPTSALSDQTREDALCQTYEAQIAIAGWAARTWSALVRAIAAPGAAANAQGEALCRAADELDAGVDRATRRVRELHAAYTKGVAAGRGGDLAEALSRLVQDLGRDFAGSWRDRVRLCIVALVTASSGPRTPPTTASTSPSSPSSAESGQPRISAMQKAKIRSFYDKREQVIRRETNERIEKMEEKMASERSEAREREASFARERQALVAEARYLRGRIHIEADRLKFVAYQKRCLLDVLGGQEGLFRRIDAMERERPSVSAKELIRQRWRRVLLAVRLKNRLLEMVAKAKETSDIKTQALQRMGPKGVRAAAPDPPAAAAAAQPDRAPFYGVRFQPHQHIGLRAAPVMPSRLRNRSSDVASSAGSSI